MCLFCWVSSTSVPYHFVAYAMHIVQFKFTQFTVSHRHIHTQHAHCPSNLKELCAVPRSQHHDELPRTIQCYGRKSIQLNRSMNSTFTLYFSVPAMLHVRAAIMAHGVDGNGRLRCFHCRKHYHISVG